MNFFFFIQVPCIKLLFSHGCDMLNLLEWLRWKGPGIPAELLADDEAFFRWLVWSDFSLPVLLQCLGWKTEFIQLYKIFTSFICIHHCQNKMLRLNLIRFTIFGSGLIGQSFLGPCNIKNPSVLLDVQWNRMLSSLVSSQNYLFIICSCVYSCCVCRYKENAASPPPLRNLCRKIIQHQLLRHDPSHLLQLIPALPLPPSLHLYLSRKMFHHDIS